MRGPKTSGTIQSVTRTSDGKGGSTESWGTVITLRGVLQPINAVERLGPDKETNYSTHMFYISYVLTTTITTFMRLIVGTRTFRIEFVKNPSNKNHHLELELLEIVTRE